MVLSSSLRERFDVPLGHGRFRPGDSVSYLVDTKVFSEIVKPQPDPQADSCLRLHEKELYVSSVTIGELRRASGGFPASLGWGGIG